MTTPPSAQFTPDSVETEVPAQADIVSVLHRFGGPADIVGYGSTGERVGYVTAVEISPDETEVVVVPGTIARLVATPAVEEDEETPESQ